MPHLKHGHGRSDAFRRDSVRRRVRGDFATPRIVWLRLGCCGHMVRNKYFLVRWNEKQAVGNYIFMDVAPDVI